MLLSSLLRPGIPLPYEADYPEDIRAIHTALQAAHDGINTISVAESGTAMRLMTAYLASTTQRSVRLEGTGRQHQRPIAPLVEALRSLGAKIEYLEVDGYPPLLISPAELTPRTIELDASASSQYLSALLLIAPHLSEGRYVIDTSKTPLASAPYALMTVAVLKEYGYHWSINKGVFSYDQICRTELPALISEADWTASSYAYAQVALGFCQEIYLPRLALPSLQGDSLYLPQVFEALGVSTEVCTDGVMLTYHGRISASISLDCHECPDLVPTVVATCVALSVPFKLSGVAHLRIKESDRLEALRCECLKLGANLTLTSDGISWSGALADMENEKKVLETYGDHRMAMALAPAFCYRYGEVLVLVPEVVEKSFPSYWHELQGLGYTISSS